MLSDFSRQVASKFTDENSKVRWNQKIVQKIGGRKTEGDSENKPAVGQCYYYAVFIVLLLKLKWKKIKASVRLGKFNWIPHCNQFAVSYNGFPASLSACIFALALGSFIFAVTFSKDLNHSLRALNKKIRIGRFKADIFDEFTEIISLHSNAEQLS